MFWIRQDLATLITITIVKVHFQVSAMHLQTEYRYHIYVCIQLKYTIDSHQSSWLDYLMLIETL